MSVGSVSIIIGRMKKAEQASPIAVFKENKNLNAVFANTVSTLSRISSKDKTLIGVFDKTMDINEIRGKLLNITGYNP